MEKVIYNEKNGLWYELQGDYYIPCLKLPEEEQPSIGVWGHRHLQYIKKHRKVLYLNLLTSGKLNGYLSDLEKQAEEMFSRLVKQMAEREGVTEQNLRWTFYTGLNEYFKFAPPLAQNAPPKMTLHPLTSKRGCICIKIRVSLFKKCKRTENLCSKNTTFNEACFSYKICGILRLYKIEMERWIMECVL